MARLVAVAVATALVMIAAPPASAQQAAERPPRLEARAWILVDGSDGAVLAARRPDRTLQIASATKLMTARLALEDLELARFVRAPRYDAMPVESVVGLERGEQMKVRDLLYALILASANDAAVALAEAHSGSVDAFVAEMNEEAEGLGLENTSFANPIGFDDTANYSTAADLAELARVLRRSPPFRRIADAEERRLRSGAVPREIETRNTLLGRVPWATGIKTGHTRRAGYVLVSSAERGGVGLIGVVLGTDSEAARDAESLELLEYGFGLYENRFPVRRGDPPATVPVRYTDDELALEAARSVSVRTRDDQRLRTEVIAPALVEGPIAAGERLGRIEVSLDGEVVGGSPLVAARAVAAPGVFDRHGGEIVAVLVGITIVIAVASAWAARQRRRRRERERMRARRADEDKRMREELG